MCVKELPHAASFSEPMHHAHAQCNRQIAIATVQVVCGVLGGGGGGRLYTGYMCFRSASAPPMR